MGGLKNSAHDEAWGDVQFKKLALQITSCMRPDGVVMFFLPWDLLHTVSVAMHDYGWKPFRQPIVWVFVAKPAYRFSKQPCTAG